MTVSVATSHNQTQALTLTLTTSTGEAYELEVIPGDEVFFSGPSGEGLRYWSTSAPERRSESATALDPQVEVALETVLDSLSCMVTQAADGLALVDCKDRL